MYVMSTAPLRKSGSLGESPVWMRPPPGSRRPRHTRDDIAAAALKIADDEGIDAVSMRRVAAELDAGTMTLYHYVSTKAELFSLLSDAVMAELIVPGPLAADWREALKQIARSTRDSMFRHPWVLGIVGQLGGLGPNAVRHFEQSLEALRSAPADFTVKMDIIAALDEYTFGYCKHRRQEESEAHDEDALQDGFAYIEALLATGDFPQIAALLQQYDVAALVGIATGMMTSDARFERNLDRLLDSYATDLAN
jgi:AcrR family transcriptional regulator